MSKLNLQDSFIEFCKKNSFEKNNHQIEIVNLLDQFLHPKKTFFKNLFINKNKFCFYLHGNVGVGKTMILNFIYDQLKIEKKRLHFNEFMISFHDFVFENKKNKKENIIDKFVNKIKKKYELIYLDEFQVTNIVDAMILGNLFKKIFDENIKVLFSSNIKINDLYKEGLQREQFMPFIKIMKNKCYQQTLDIKEDYRKSLVNKNERFLYPLNENTNFKVNKYFRQITKNIPIKEKVLTVKGRKFYIKKYYNGISRFDFTDLCTKNIGAEDYIKISEVCNFIIIENIPNFNNDNSNHQQRFVTLIDILYEKNIPLMISSKSQLNLIGSSKGLANVFKRTISRLYELTSIKYN